MPYKVVLTIEKGKSVLTSVPESWEKNGILFWPPKNATEKIKQEAYPQDDWKSINCVVKRKNVVTFENAEEEIDRMCEHSDTEYIETADEMPSKKRLKKKKAKISISSTQPDFNDQAQECIKVSVISCCLLSSSSSSSLSAITSTCSARPSFTMKENWAIVYHAGPVRIDKLHTPSNIFSGMQVSSRCFPSPL